MSNELERSNKPQVAAAYKKLILGGTMVSQPQSLSSKNNQNINPSQKISDGYKQLLNSKLRIT